MAFSLAASSLAAQSTDPRSRASVDSNGVEGNSDSTLGALSRDGRHVAFSSFSGNLVAGGSPPAGEVYVHDRSTGATVMVSVDSNGVWANQWSRQPVPSADGRFVAFESDADNLVAADGNQRTDVFVHDRDPDGNGVFDEGNGVTTRVSEPTGGGDANSTSEYPAISADGTVVAFRSFASNLVSGDNNGVVDIFVRDVTTGTTTRVSVNSLGAQANAFSDSPSISGDGRFVAFRSTATNLVNGDLNGCDDIFVHDRTTGTTVLGSVDSSGVQADFTSDTPFLNGDGSRVVFESQADNLSTLDNKNHSYDVFLHDFTTGATTLVSADSSGHGANNRSWGPTLSEDGLTATFVSLATNLSPNDNDNYYDVFVRDLNAGTTSIVSQTAWLESASSILGRISGDGRCVIFVSPSASLVADDLNGRDDVFVYDRTIPEPVAASATYGAGYPGTNGVPNFTASGAPVYGAAPSLTIDNSSGAWTPALLALGFARASIPTRAGGTLLVDAPTFYVEAIPPLGLAIPFAVPLDPALCGLVVDLQALELDPGASFGISFTPGLEWTFGN